jgi:hypothetical protein
MFLSMTCAATHPWWLPHQLSSGVLSFGFPAIEYLRNALANLIFLLLNIGVTRGKLSKCHGNHDDYLTNALVNRSECILSACNCNRIGSYGIDCNQLTGTCNCRRNVIGEKCDAVKVCLAFLLLLHFWLANSNSQVCCSHHNVGSLFPWARI